MAQAFEELQVAQEELRVQNDALAAADAAADLERERYRDLFEHAPSGYLVTDADGVVCQANRAAGDLLNVAPKYLVGKPLSVFVSSADRPAFLAQLAGLQAGLDEQWGDPERPEAWVERLDDQLRAMAPRYEAVLEHKFYEAEAYARRLEDRVARLEEEYRRLAAWSARLDEALRRANPLKNRLRALLARRRPSPRPAGEPEGARG